MSVTLHRYSQHPAPGDLTRNDLGILWGLMLAEDLVEIFFHDGFVRSFAAFEAFAGDPDTWFYAAKKDGVFIGIGVVNNITNSGNTACAHLASFICGRDGSFAEAGRIWFELLRTAGGLETLIAIIPHCYRGTRRWAEAFGFVEKMRLPGAMILYRANGKTRRADECVYLLNLNDGE